MKHALFALLPFAASPVAAEVPPWLREAAALEAPAYPPKVLAVILHQEERLVVDAEGRRRITERGALRILQPGRHGISAYRSYIVKSGKISQFRAWLISPSGKETEFSKEKILDVSSGGGALNDESRAKLVECPPEAAPGSVFGWEIVEEESTVFTQYHYSFQQSQPVLLSRFAITLPPGWEAAGTLLNHPQFAPSVSGDTSAWELRNLPNVESEDYGPGFSALVPRLGVSYYPPDGNRPGLRPLKDWASVSAWLAELADPSSQVSPLIQARAESLVGGASSESAKIAAIAAFVQQTNYVSVQLNTNRGGGYVPRPAADVLTSNYGDCKDKAALMRALLAAVGIRSYDVSVYSGNRHFVRPEWPSTLQFNHAIVAVKVAPETNMPAVLDHPTLGRLLFIDPTDPNTPPGDLPRAEQGSYALVSVREGGDLVKLPLLPPGASRSESVISARLSAGGALQVESARLFFGQSASRMRSLASSRDPGQFKSYFEADLHKRLGRVTLVSIRHSDQKALGRFEMNLSFSLDRFGQLMQGRLLVVQPGLLCGSGALVFAENTRSQPIQLYPQARSDTVRIEMPPGFTPDELPEPIETASPYGSYSASWTVQQSTLIFKQSLEIRDALVAASDYAAVRGFFSKAAAGATAPAVFVLAPQTTK